MKIILTLIKLSPRVMVCVCDDFSGAVTLGIKISFVGDGGLSALGSMF